VHIEAESCDSTFPEVYPIYCKKVGLAAGGAVVKALRYKPEGLGIDF
jgi:hypothetical protein